MFLWSISAPVLLLKLSIIKQLHGKFCRSELCLPEECSGCFIFARGSANASGLRWRWVDLSSWNKIFNSSESFISMKFRSMHFRHFVTNLVWKSRDPKIFVEPFGDRHHFYFLRRRRHRWQPTSTTTSTTTTATTSATSTIIWWKGAISSVIILPEVGRTPQLNPIVVLPSPGRNKAANGAEPEPEQDKDRQDESKEKFS